MKHHELIGQNIIGFKFLDNGHVGYNSVMNKYIGQDGEIVQYDDGDFRSYRVNFGHASYWYPANEVEQQFIKQPEEEIDINKLFEQIKQLKP